MQAAVIPAYKEKVRQKNFSFSTGLKYSFGSTYSFAFPARVLT